MPAFISSAVGSKKAAPKAPARRRPAPPPPSKPVQPNEAPASDSVAPASEPVALDTGAVAPASEPAPSSPPPTQQEPQLQVRTETPPPQPATHSSPDARPRADAPPRATAEIEAAIHSEPETRPKTQRVATPPSTQDHVEQLADFVGARTLEQTQPQPQSQLIEEPAQVETEQSAASPAPTPAATQPPPTEQNATRAAAPAGKKRKSDGAETQQPKPPAKRQKKSSARSNAKVQTAVDGEDGRESVPPSASTKKTARPAKRAVAATQNGKSKRRANAKSAETVVESPEPGQEEAEVDPEEVDSEAQSVAPAPKRKRRKKKSQQAREQTENDGEGSDDESDPEAHEIDPKTVSLFDLSHDSIHGKVSDREKKMAEINWDEVARKRFEAIETIRAGKKHDGEERETGKQQPAPDGEVVPSVEGPDGTSEAGRTPQADGEDPAGDGTPEDGATVDGDATGSDTGGGLGTVAGPKLIMVNGEMVLDETSLNRPNEAAADDIMEEIEEENDLTQRLNRTTWMTNRRRDPTERVPAWRLKSDPWGNEETDRFYDALKMFGTDFFIISKMFEPKTRKQIKLKFNREEKLDPMRIRNTLLGLNTKPMDLQHYARETGEDISVFTKYDSFAHAEQVIRESMRDKEEAMQAAVEEEEENQRQAKVQAGQKEEAKKIAERKRAEKRGMRAANKGRKIGAGTMGGGAAEDE
ncbi:hypothetical protein LTR08_006026 [Meristemomyces frigidus]|nr:hypothetical protein LTR08_006026 [Meristemomyces frigidus]